MSAQEQERRPDGFVDAVGALGEILARHPGESARVSPVWSTPRPFKAPWWRVTVRIGEAIAAFSPRFEVFDDATSFRVRAERMANDGS